MEQSRQYPEDVLGLLKFKFIDGDLTRDTELTGQMDPYVELFIGGVRVYKTEVKDDAGKNPVWNEECTYEVKDRGLEVRLIVSDEEVFSDDVIGERTMQLS